LTTILETTALNKHFGGLHATRDVSMRLKEGTLHAVIGPNGAGKTTLVSQLFGEIRPTSGRIEFCGRDITRLPAHRRARLGMARTFQITTLARDLTVRQNLALAMIAADGHAFRFLRALDTDTNIQCRIGEVLSRLSIVVDIDRRIADLSHGEQRMLELAMSLVAGPKLLLLDEPMAGLGLEESRSMTSFLLGLKGKTTILLIEHDMEAVFALADEISVLVRGQLLATGSPADVRADRRVQDAYLGEDA
jgi:branched-chain amino acid transport system ATP-binding protein